MKYLAPIFLTILPALCYSQEATIISHSAATSNYSLNSNNVWSVSCNPSGIIEMKKIAAGLFYSNHFMMKDLSSQYLVCAFPLNKTISSAVSVFRFGNELFSRNQLSFASAMNLSNKIKLGAQIHLQYIHQSEQPALYYAFPELGMSYRINTKISMGAALKNFTENIHPAQKTQEKQIFRIGLTYVFDEKVRLHAQTIFERRTYPFIAVGVDYFPTEKIYLGFNISSTNQPFNIGVGYKMKSAEIKIAFAYHQLLGTTPASSITL
ncbi:MAG: hypothetical protein ACKOXB_01860 [Flavobacteriales bacterium]